MEAGGLALSVVALCTAFSSCMACFEYIELGRNCGSDFNKCVLQLDVARLRLSRWAVSIGLDKAIRDKTPVSAPDEEIEAALGLMGQIQYSFRMADLFSQKFKRSSSAAALATYDTPHDLSVDFQNLHKTVRELAVKRQAESSIIRKAKCIV